MIKKWKCGHLRIFSSKANADDENGDIFRLILKIPFQNVIHFVFKVKKNIENRYNFFPTNSFCFWSNVSLDEISHRCLGRNHLIVTLFTLIKLIKLSVIVKKRSNDHLFVACWSQRCWSKKITSKLIQEIHLIFRENFHTKSSLIWVSRLQWQIALFSISVDRSLLWVHRIFCSK